MSVLVEKKAIWAQVPSTIQIAPFLRELVADPVAVTAVERAHEDDFEYFTDEMPYIPEMNLLAAYVLVRETARDDAVPNEYQVLSAFLMYHIASNAALWDSDTLGALSNLMKQDPLIPRLFAYGRRTADLASTISLHVASIRVIPLCSNDALLAFTDDISRPSIRSRATNNVSDVCSSPKGHEIQWDMASLLSVDAMNDHDAQLYVTAVADGNCSVAKQLEDAAERILPLSPNFPMLVRCASAFEFRGEVMSFAGSMSVKLWEVPEDCETGVSEELCSPNASRILAYMWHHAGRTKQSSSGQFPKSMTVIAMNRTEDYQSLSLEKYLIIQPTLASQSFITIWTLPQDYNSGQQLARSINRYLSLLQSEIWHYGRFVVCYIAHDQPPCCLSRVFSDDESEEMKDDSAANQWAGKVGPYFTTLDPNHAFDFNQSTRSLVPSQSNEKGYLMLFTWSLSISADCVEAVWRYIDFVDIDIDPVANLTFQSISSLSKTD